MNGFIDENEKSNRHRGAFEAAGVTSCESSCVEQDQVKQHCRWIRKFLIYFKEKLMKLTFGSAFSNILLMESKRSVRED